jgi:hypothetical protein
MRTSARTRYAGYRFPAEIIGHAVWLYFRFPLGLRMVEELLAARGIIVSHETVRQWARKFGQQFANQIRRRLPRVGDKWHLDEVVLKITGVKHWLWRAVDQAGVVLDSASPSPAATASEGSVAVEETFQTAMRPLFSSKRQISVKVPPESMPIRHAIYPYHSVGDPLPIIMGRSRRRNQVQGVMLVHPILSTVRYLGIEVDDVLIISEQVELFCGAGRHDQRRSP